MKKRIILFLIIVTSFNLRAQQHPWQMFHKDQAHAGNMNVKGPQSATVKWKYNLGQSGGQGPNSIAISNTGRIYVCGPNKITALDRSGNLKWTKPYPGAQGPALSKDGNNIYIVSLKNIIALDSLGNQKWSYTAGDTMIFGTTVSANDSVLYQGCWDRYVYAINTWNGTLKWKYFTSGAVSYPPAIATDGSILIGGGDAHKKSDSTIYALYPNGTLKWKYIVQGTGGVHCGSPVIGMDGLIYEAAQPILYVLNNNGVLQWSAGTFQNEIAGIISPSLTPDTTIYIGSNKGIIRAINGKTHQVKWSYQTGPDPNQSNFYGVLAFPVTDNEGTVFTGAVDHRIYALDKNGTIKWTYTTGGRITEASPALDSDGTLYISSEDGWLYAFWDTLSAGVSSPGQGKIKITVYPNPSMGKFLLTAKEDKIMSALVYNVTGELILATPGKGQATVSIDLGGFTDGVYFVKLVLQNGIETKRLVLQGN